MPSSRNGQLLPVEGIGNGVTAILWQLGSVIALHGSMGLQVP